MKVLVLDDGYADHVDGLDVVRGEELAGDDVAGLLIDVHVPVREEDLEPLRGLRVIATASTGFDHVDVAAASKRGVWVCNIPDYCTEEVAETTIGFLLALVRGIAAHDRRVRAGSWDPRADHVVDYTREDFTRSDRRYDLMLDIAGSRSWSECRRVLDPHATLVIVGAAKGNRLIGPLSHIFKLRLAPKCRRCSAACLYRWTNLSGEGAGGDA